MNYMWSERAPICIYVCWSTDVLTWQCLTNNWFRQSLNFVFFLFQFRSMKEEKKIHKTSKHKNLQAARCLCFLFHALRFLLFFCFVCYCCCCYSSPSYMDCMYALSVCMYICAVSSSFYYRDLYVMIIRTDLLYFSLFSSHTDVSVLVWRRTGEKRKSVYVCVCETWKRNAFDVNTFLWGWEHDKDTKRKRWMQKKMKERRNRNCNLSYCNCVQPEFES